MHINNDMNMNFHIDINMNVDVTPPTPTPYRGRPQGGPGGGHGWGAWCDIKIHSDIYMNIEIHIIIINMDIDHYIVYSALLIPSRRSMFLQYKSPGSKADLTKLRP